jgi:hypothetical protein
LLLIVAVYSVDHIAPNRRAAAFRVAGGSGANRSRRVLHAAYLSARQHRFGEKIVFSMKHIQSCTFFTISTPRWVSTPRWELLC